MSEQHLQINVSKSKYNKREDDLIKIRLENNDVLDVHFSKLVSLSRYIRDKYKYSEALNMMQKEMEDILKEKKVSLDSFKHFIELVEEEKVNIPIKEYQNIYTLSECLDIPIFIKELDFLIKENLYQDLTFTIQILQDLTQRKDNEGTKLAIKIEDYLSTQINQCITNSKFSELPITTISRIIEKSDRENIDHNSLIDFIVKSIENRFTFLSFVDIEKLREDKINDFFNFLDNQDEKEKEKYLQYLPFSFSFFKMMKNKYNKLLKENVVKEKEHEKTKNELEQTKEKLKQTQIQLKQKEDEQTKTKDELNQTKIQLKQKEDEQTKTIEELNQTKDQLEKIKKEKKQLLPSIVTVGGNDQYNQLGKNPNNANQRDMNPPHNFQLYQSPLLSFSVYCYHSVMITSDGSLKAIGDNDDGRIISSLQKNIIDHFTDFCMKDSSGHKFDPVSAVCYVSGTVYMVSKKSGKGRQLLICDNSINGGDPVFLDIGDHHPVALFGGFSHSATIGSEGEVILINRYSVVKSPEKRIESVSLPYNEKASSVACCEDSVYVLSSNGRVFRSPVDDKSDIEFSEVFELKNIEIVSLSGTYEHVLVVTKEGRVFGRGSNDHGQLGLGNGIPSVSSFTEIKSLDEYEIRAAYAGGRHSLFETREGKVLSCGYNSYGQLLLNGGEGGPPVYLPKETAITEGATFCIAGWCNSTVFTGVEPPPNTPNRRIEEYK